MVKFEVIKIIKVSLCCWYKSQSNDSEGTGSGSQYGPAIALFGDTRNSVWGGFGMPIL